MPGAETGLVDYISRHPKRRAEKKSADEIYNEKFFVAKLQLISASASSLNLNSSQIKF